MTAIEVFRDGLERALDQQIIEFQDEIRAQGLNDTGRLINSLRRSVEIKAAQLLGKIEVEDYGLFLSKGVRPNKVKYNPNWLKPWAKRKKPSLSDKEINSFVWSVYQTHKKEGIASKGSVAFSKNGFRRKWIERGIQAGKADLDSTLVQEMGKFAQNLVNDEFRELFNRAA